MRHGIPSWNEDKGQQDDHRGVPREEGPRETFTVLDVAHCNPHHDDAEEEPGEKEGGRLRCVRSRGRSQRASGSW